MGFNISCTDEWLRWVDMFCSDGKRSEICRKLIDNGLKNKPTEQEIPDYNFFNKLSETPNGVEKIIKHYLFLTDFMTSTRMTGKAI